MLIVIIIILVILLIIGCVLESNGNMAGEILAFSSFCCGIIAVLILIILLIFFPYGVEKKISMYEEENTSIENKVKEIVRAYMNYEQETYENLIKTSDLTTLMLKYPEFNSNELVQAKIETYKENSNKIKELKEKEINKSIMAWWLYFGK